MRFKFLFVVLVAMLLLVFAAPALAAGPIINNLASPTHPDQYSTYYSNDPEFTWSASPGPYGWCDTPGNALNVTIADGLAYVADDYWESGLRLIDVTSPSAPEPLSSISTPGRAYDVTVVGDYAYVAFWSGLQVVDVSTPAEPIQLGVCYTPDWGCDVEVVGSYAYLPCDTAGFQIIDVSTPDDPHVVGSIYPGGRCWGVDVVGDRAFIATSEGLSIVDVGIPSEPVLLGGISVGTWCSQVSVVGDTAYLAAGLAYGDGIPGLHVIDVNSPSQPQVLGSCGLGDYPGAIVIDGTTAYVAAGSQGVQVVDVSNPAAPAVTRSLGTPGRANGLALDGGLFYVADGGNGLVVLDQNADPSSTEFAYSYSLDQVDSQEPDHIPDPVDNLENPSVILGDVRDGTWWFHVRAVDGDGVWGPTAHYQVNVDHRPTITSLWSTTHYWGDWTANNHPQFAWIVNAPCDAFSYAIDQVDGQEPDEDPDPVDNLENPSVTLTDVPDGSWWFHVRAVDAEGNWGPAQQYYIAVKTEGPVTMALSAKSAKRASIVLQYSVHDFTNWGAAVSIEIKKAGGATVRTIDCGWREFDRVYATSVSGLTKGRYTYTVHARDWLGNPEREAGTAGFTVR